MDTFRMLVLCEIWVKDGPGDDQQPRLRERGVLDMLPTLARNLILMRSGAHEECGESHCTLEVRGVAYPAHAGLIALQSWDLVKITIMHRRGEVRARDAVCGEEHEDDKRRRHHCPEITQIQQQVILQTKKRSMVLKARHSVTVMRQVFAH